jgi:predicted small metal-binding protein
MEKLLRCGDVVPGCTEEVRGATEEEILRQAADHARTAHGIEKIDDQTAAKVKAAIRTVQ